VGKKEGSFADDNDDNDDDDDDDDDDVQIHTCKII
jgi:hypothetical protein